MKVSMNNSPAFGYYASGVVKGHAFNKAPKQRKQVLKTLLETKINPFGQQNNIKITIKALDLHNFWDRLRFKKSPYEQPMRYRLSVEISKANEKEPLLQKLKHIFTPEYKIVAIGNDDGLIPATNELITNLEASPRPNRPCIYYLGNDYISYRTF